MKRIKPIKVRIEFNKNEISLVRKILLNFRNNVLKAGGPTEDIDALLMKLL